MNIQTLFRSWDFFSYGEKMLFLPLIIIIVILLVGLVLFVIANLISGLVHIQKELFSRTIDKKEDEEEVFKHHIKIDESSKIEDMIIGLKSGSWLVWVALLPLILIIVIGILYLVRITPLGF
jgi:cell division protein FtsL